LRRIEGWCSAGMGSGRIGRTWYLGEGIGGGPAGVNPAGGGSRRGSGRRLRDHGPVRGPGTCARLCVTLLAPYAA
jgi:hypothetical protein